MPESETYYNQPTFPKDAEYCECWRCDGDGWIYDESYSEVPQCAVGWVTTGSTIPIRASKTE